MSSMSMTAKKSWKALALGGVLAVMATGCASKPASSDQNAMQAAERKAAEARAKVYLEGYSIVTASTWGASCSFEKKASPGRVDWKDLLARASSCTAKKDWATLEAIASTLAESEIDSPWGAYFLSVAAEERGDHARAMWMVELATKKAGGQALFTFQKGRVWLGLGEVGKAVSEFEKSVALEPRLTDAHLYLGDLYLRDLEANKAAKNFRLVLEREPANTRALIGLAETRLLEDDPKQAAELYEKAVAGAPKDLKAWLRLGYVYETIQKNNVLALSTYRSLRTFVDSGSIKEKPSFDLVAKIKALESVVQKESVQKQPVQVPGQKEPARAAASTEKKGA